MRSDPCALRTAKLGTVLRTLGQNPTEAELQGMMDEVAASFDFPQLLVFLQRRLREADAEEEELLAGFRAFDRDGRGSIPVADFGVAPAVAAPATAAPGASKPQQRTKPLAAPAAAPARADPLPLEPPGRGAVATRTLESLSVINLKKLAHERGVSLTGCFEKHEIVAELQRWGVRPDSSDPEDPTASLLRSRCPLWWTVQIWEAHRAARSAAPRREQRDGPALGRDPRLAPAQGARHGRLPAARAARPPALFRRAVR